MLSPKHPLWLVGFRPFFALACLAGLTLPILWALVFAGRLSPPNGLSPFQWHAHEMFFGFGWAVLGGFLLTSTKNWVQIRGYHGRILQFLVAAWLLERLAMGWGGHWPRLLFLVAANLYLGLIVALLAWTLISNRKADSYRDNYFFLIILPVFLAAKNLLISPDNFALGWSLTQGLFRLAFLVMLERTLTPFMKGAFQVNILRNPSLDMAIKLCALALVPENLLPVPLASGLELALGALLLVRLAFWKPTLAFTRLDIGIMYLGYLALTAHLLLGAADRILHPAWIGTLPLHVFTFGTMGLIIPAMIIRIAKGHTGRKVSFDAWDKAVLNIMILAFVVRILAPQVWPDAYLHWIYLAAAAWLFAFGILAWRVVPFLVAPRIDGKEH